jgi:hypothetical protein
LVLADATRSLGGSREFSSRVKGSSNSGKGDQIHQSRCISFARKLAAASGAVENFKCPMDGQDQRTWPRRASGMPQGAGEVLRGPFLGRVNEFLGQNEDAPKNERVRDCGGDHAAPVHPKSGPPITTIFEHCSIRCEMVH